jgi:hypothetical protein
MLKLTGRSVPGTNKLRNKILEWLQAPDPILQHRRARKQHQMDTGKWFLEDESFAFWKQEANSAIWVYGKCLCSVILIVSNHLSATAAGIGKTILLFVIHV